jgi:CheY-like chemotaxis protein
MSTRILVVEDQEDNRRLVGDLLTSIPIVAATPAL